MSPLLLVGLAAALLLVARSVREHERGVALLRTVAGVGGWLGLAVLSASPLAHWSVASLPNHMIGHILLMFLFPLAIVLGAPTLRRTNDDSRRRLPRRWNNTLVAAVILNAVMIAAHVPAIFDYAMAHSWARLWLMEPAFLLSGIWFFSTLITDRRGSLLGKIRWQVAGIVLTMFVMLVTAMAMSIFTKAVWYTPMGSMGSMSMPGMSTANAFSQQQLAGAILWICGDLWAVPMLVVLVRRVIRRDGSLWRALDRYSPEGSSELRP